MSISPFTSFQTNPVLSGANSVVKKSGGQDKTQKNKKIIETVKTIAPIAISVAAVPVAAIVASKMTAKKVSNISNDLVNGLKNEISSLTTEVAGLKALNEQRSILSNQGMQGVVNSVKKDNAQIWSAILAATGLAAAYKAGELKDEDKVEIAQKASEARDKTNSKIDYATNMAQQAQASSGNNLSRKYLKNYNGISLLTNNDSLSRNQQKYNAAIEKIKTAAPQRLFNQPNVPEITNPNPSLWSITSEFAPIKEGGLGSVPVEIKTNLAKLGVQMPTFIPMYQQNGVASLTGKGDELTYTYKKNAYSLEKVASYKVDVFKDGKSSVEDVEIFVGTPQDARKKNQELIFVKNDNYFNGTIYQTTQKTEEPEKFAFFSKAVYEFAKAKFDENSVKGLNIYSREAFDGIQQPDGLVLNDWQASPIAALARYKAPIENAYSQLSDDAAQKLSDMRIITIGHNAMYQGSTRNNNDNTQRYEATSNILNTLFDNFADDIVSNATSGAVSSNPSDKGLKNLDNVLLLNADNKFENHTNLLNMGICLSDYFHPVSQNYAQELISDEHPELAGELRWALTQKDNAGSLVGIINGNDFNGLSIEARANSIKGMTSIDLQTYSKTSNIIDVMRARAHNKEAFYTQYILPFTLKNDKTNNDPQVNAIRKVSERLEFVESDRMKTNAPVLTSAELAKTPVLSSAGRFVSQKGVDILADAISILYKNWDKDFPGKNKPIFYIAGADGEGGVQRKHIENLKEKGLKQEDSDRVIFGHGFAPMSAIMACSDFFMLPSRFEPCGLTQGESFAVATPVIASAVGGIVDTVNRDGKKNGVLTDQSKPLSAQGLYEAMKEGLNIYFEKPVEYQNMVNDSLAEDFSWIQKDKKGPVFEYLEKIGVNTSKLPDVI